LRRVFSVSWRGRDGSRSAVSGSGGEKACDAGRLIHLLDADRAGFPAPPGWLGAQLGLTSPSTTALIDRLESAGHVARQRSSADRRKVEIRVSDEAVALGWEFFGPLLTGMVRAMRSFDAAELDTVDRFLREVAAAASWPGR
jgi:DNA-binding MarR family transcriptional regulator